MQPRDSLAKIYALCIDSGWKRVQAIEQYLDRLGPDHVSIDDRRNEHRIYQELAEKHRAVLDDLFKQLLHDMRAVRYEHASGILDGLDFLQSVVASTLWKHHFTVGDSLERFAREFDRLDVPDERRRLYQLAQNLNS